MQLRYDREHAGASEPGDVSAATRPADLDAGDDDATVGGPCYDVLVFMSERCSSLRTAALRCGAIIEVVHQPDERGVNDRRM